MATSDDAGRASALRTLDDAGNVVTTIRLPRFTRVFGSDPIVTRSRSRLTAYAPDGRRRWSVRARVADARVAGDRVYTVAGRPRRVRVTVRDAATGRRLARPRPRPLTRLVPTEADGPVGPPLFVGPVAGS